MKRVLITIIMGITLLTAWAGNGAERITMGYFPHKPHQFLPDGATKPRGAMIAYVEMMASKMGYEIEWVGPLPFTRLLDYLREGKIDGAVNLAVFPEIQQIVLYGNQPIHFSQSVFVVRKENPLSKITSVQDVEGYRVAWLANVSTLPFIQENLPHFQMDYVPQSDTVWQQQVKKLLLDRVDALYELNDYTLPYAAKELGVYEQIKVLPLPDPPIPMYVGFSKQSPRAQQLLEQYNAVQAGTPFNPDDYARLIQQEFDALTSPSQ